MSKYIHYNVYMIYFIIKKKRGKGKMKTKAVRLYGKEDLRLEEFELPEMKDDELLARVVSDSICMSTETV